MRRGLPPGSNVGTQLRARRAAAARAERKSRAALLEPGRGRPGDLRQLALPSAEGWFAAHGWRPFEFQRAVWSQVAAGRSGLLHAATGTGKTYALWFALLNRALAGEFTGGGLRLLWITPMRALAADTARALQAPLAELGLDWQVGVRSGDTDAAERTRQGRRLPEALVTTPESLSLLLARADAHELFAGLQMVVVDEWHELIGNKRGVQVQLALARLKRCKRGGGGLPLWGLSATLGNTREAMQALLAGDEGVLVEGEADKPIVVDTLLPEDPGRFAWGGHLGLQMLEPVVREIAAGGTTLVFTNTRSQAELWYQAILEAKPDWAGLIALHHGSLDRELRDWVEAGLKEGRLKAVVATSSLDLGVDFLPVQRVLQVGSAKGVARMMQRAGRSGHAPGRTSRLTLVPTQALELVEAAAAVKAAAARLVESRRVPDKPLDVLVQHLVTVALGSGFTERELLAEVRSTASYAQLTDAEWRWCLEFVAGGGRALSAYPEYRRVQADAAGVHRVADEKIARRHRMSVGTIVSESAMLVRLRNGKRLGTIEEGFIARLHPGDVFVFAGRRLELLRVREMTAYVAPARAGSGAVPRWSGLRLPLSDALAQALLAEFEGAAAGRFDTPELRRVQPLLELQRRWSALPTRRTLLAETWRSRQGHHLYLYPFAGRLANLGLASLLALRLGRMQPATFSIAVNDYGFELATATEIGWREALRPARGLLADDDLLPDVLASLNAGELVARRFREIARVGGLVFQGYPGQPKAARELQASAGLIYEVLRRHDAGNLLLGQAEREVLEQELDLARLRAALARMRSQSLVVQALSRPSPLSFPLYAESLREQLSTERLNARIERLVAELERAAG